MSAEGAEGGGGAVSRVNAGPPGRFRVSVKTFDVRGAGTDADVEVTVIGADGDRSGPHLLENEPGKGNADPFERGQMDEFLFEVNTAKPPRVYHPCTIHDVCHFGSHQ